MKVREICRSDVVTVSPLASLREAAILMRNRHVGTLIVVEEGAAGLRPTGILTDRDIVVAVIAVPGARPEGIRVCDVMATRLAVAREDDGVYETAQSMRAFGVRRLPVVAADGTLRGIVSADDVLRLLGTEMTALAAAFETGAAREVIERRVLDVLARAGRTEGQTA
jgi:CBS domain-containing protein